MKIRTRLHDPTSGAYVRDVSALDFGSVTDGAATAPLVLSLRVEGVQKISGVSFVVEDSKSVDLDSGAFRFDRSMTFRPDHVPAQEFSNDRRRFNVRNVDDYTTEFVYLTFDSARTPFTGSGVIGFRWSFDYVDASSSSSSSSSNNFGICERVNEGDVVSVTIPYGNEECFDIRLDSTEYASIFVNGTEIEAENDSGVLIFAEEVLPLGMTIGIEIGGTWYSTTLVHDADTRFIVRMVNIGASSSSFSLAANTLYELVDMTNSSSSSDSSSSSSPSSSSGSSSSSSSSS